MKDKSKEQLEQELEMRDCQAQQRAISDEKYADQKEFSLVQKIVFSIISLILIAVVGALVNLVISK